MRCIEEFNKSMKRKSKEVWSMLLNYSVKGYRVFYDEVSFSMVANNYIKKNKENLIKNKVNYEEINVVKSSFIFGPNNTGKSCFIESLEFFVNIIKNEKLKLNYYYKNLFYEESEPIVFKIEYLVNNRKYYYELSINYDGIEDEKFKIDDILILDRKNPKDEIKQIIDLIGDDKNKFYVFLLPVKYKFASDDLKYFANSFVFVNFSEPLNVDEILKESNLSIISSLISKCDIQVDSIINNTKNYEDIITFLDEDAKESRKKYLDILKIGSEFTFKGQRMKVPFDIINSKGTSKVLKLAYILLNAINEDKIIIIDEFESSLHTIMSKNLILFFNSYNNTKSQLIATTYDLLLLDDQFLLRKDQIWFIHKDESNNYLYCLDFFKDNKEIDSRGNVMIKYLKGLFGALPKPRLFRVKDEESNTAQKG